MFAMGEIGRCLYYWSHCVIFFWNHTFHCFSTVSFYGVRYGEKRNRFQCCSTFYDVRYGEKQNRFQCCSTFYDVRYGEKRDTVSVSDLTMTKMAREGKQFSVLMSLGHFMILSAKARNWTVLFLDRTLSSYCVHHFIVRRLPDVHLRSVSLGVLACMHHW